MLVLLDATSFILKGEVLTPCAVENKLCYSLEKSRTESNLAAALRKV